MTSERDLGRLLGAFLAEGPDQLADRVIDAALDQIDQTQQRRVLRVPWRFPDMNMLTRVAAAAVIGVLLVGTFFYLTRPTVPPIGPAPSPGFTAIPSAPALVAPSPTGPTAVITAAPIPTYALQPGAWIAYVNTTDKARMTPDNPNGAACYSYDPTCPVSRVWVIRADGSGAHELLPDGSSPQVVLGWAPDGSRLLYAENQKLYLTDSSGSTPQLLDTGCLAPCHWDDSAAFSSDGTHLVFVRNSVDASGYDGITGIATLDLTSGQIAELRSTVNAGAFLPGWSPDGSQIVFSFGGDKDMGGPIPARKAAVFVVDADGQNLHQVSPTTLAAEYASWSPDGSLIVFVSPEAQGQDIYTMRPDGTGVQRLTTDGISSAATWTPDGRILFVRGSSDAGQAATLWTMGADGSNAAPLAPGAVSANPYGDFLRTDPVWQPSGGPAIVPPPWHPSTGTAVGPPPATPIPTPTPALAPGFSWTGSMHASDNGNTTETATLLDDGRVLVTTRCEPVAEVYDPLTGTFSPTGPMTVTRGGATATRLLDGRVLIAGGGNCGNAGSDGIWASAELFDPATATFSPTGSMSAPREAHAATLLADGRVLITGGMTGSPPPVAFQVVFASYQGGSYQGGHLAATQNSSNVLASAELYDPTTGTFSPTGSMSQFRDQHTSTLLQDGRVLVVGGGGEGYASLTSAELYDPVAGTFSDTGSLAKGRWLHTATLLRDGRVLITGGKAPNDKTYASAELYDPGSGKFSSAGSMGDGRQQHTATLLEDGRVLIAGGYQYDGQNWTVLSSTEIYDPGNGTFTAIGSMGDARDGQVAVLLSDGRVLICGGTGIGNTGLVALSTAVLYQP